MEVKVRIKCCHCDFNSFECWAYIDLETKEEHDTFGSRAFTEIKFSDLDEVPEGWKKESRLSKLHRYMCSDCASNYNDF